MRPHVTLKLATSLDGRIATASGESRWITGDLARAEVHRMRAESDAVLIGAETARADDPELLARIEPAPKRQPSRVVIASRFDLPRSGRLLATLAQAPLIVIGAEDNAARGELETAGARTFIASSGDGVDLGPALNLLAANGITKVLVEGGGRIASSLIEAGLVDRLEWFRASILLGAEGRPAIAGLSLARLADAPAFRRIAVRELGPDLWESYERA